MPSRLTLAAGVLGVASLAFVGVGGYAAFTSNVNLDTSATPGTFLLNASVGSTGEGCATGNIQISCFPKDAANYNTNIGKSVVSNNSIVTPHGTNAIATWTIPNMAPGDTYYSDYTLTDVGTLQGKVSTVTYNPPTSLSPTQKVLLNSMRVTVEEKFNGTWYILPQLSNDFGGTGNGNHNALASWTFGTAVTGGKVPFLQPVSSSPNYEQSAEFRVVYTLLDSAGNSVEGVTVAPSLSFIGTSLP